MTNEVFSVINLFKLISFCKHANAFIFSIVLQKQAMSKPVMLMNYIHTVVHFSHYSLILWQLYMQRWNVQYKLTYCTVLLWRIFISLCVFSQYLYFCQRHPHACARAVFLSTHSAFVSMGHCFFSAFQRVTVSGISWLAKPSVQTLDFNLVLFLLAQCSQYLLLTILVS